MLVFMEKTVLTLALIRDGEKLLLGRKKRGFGAGRWNGFGGKLAPGETIEQAAKREVTEECGLTVEEMTKCAVVTFFLESRPDFLEVHFFRVLRFSGTPRESDEMEPRWFPVANLPLKQMWADDTYWMPFFLRGECFEGEFYYDAAEQLLRHNLRGVTALQG
jgi:8-oxo-dGTP diphosphatase / 2-hydroxy-dATP diphosphatase